MAIGYQQVHAVPGAFRISRAEIAVNSVGWTQVNIRDAAWAPSCPYLPDAPTGQQAADAAARAVLKQASIRLVSGTSVQIAEEAVPGDRWNSADAAAPGLVLAVPAWAARTGWWWRTSGAVVLEVEVYFDIPVVT